MEFKRVNIDDVDLIRTYINAQPYRSCDYTLGVIYIWNDLFKYEYAIVDDCLVLRLNIDGENKYLYPLGKNVDKVIKKIGVCSYTSVPIIETSKFNSFKNCDINHRRDHDDYCYDIVSLSTLQGKINSKHRNHVNKFLRTYQYQFVEYNVKDYEKAEEFLNNYHKAGLSSESSEYELNANKMILKDYEKIGQYIYLLKCDDKVIGLTMGEIIDDCLFIHIEKALIEYEGSFPTVNKLFAQTMLERFPNLKYINREDDAGDEGLRTSKTNYHPLFMVLKFDVDIKEK